MNAKKAATFLQYSSVYGNKLFLKQEELLQHDSKKKEGTILIIHYLYSLWLAEARKWSSMVMETEAPSIFGS